MKVYFSTKSLSLPLSLILYTLVFSFLFYLLFFLYLFIYLIFCLFNSVSLCFFLSVFPFFLLFSLGEHLIRATTQQAKFNSSGKYAFYDLFLWNVNLNGVILSLQVRELYTFIFTFFVQYKFFKHMVIW